MKTIIEKKDYYLIIKAVPKSRFYTWFINLSWREQ